MNHLAFFFRVRSKANIYENVTELKLSCAEDKVDAKKEAHAWQATPESDGASVEPGHCVQLRVKKATGAGDQPKALRGTASYSSTASSSSYSSSTNSWSSRMKLAVQRKLSSGGGAESPLIDEPPTPDKYVPLIALRPPVGAHLARGRSDKDGNKLAAGALNKQEADDEDEHSEAVSVCQSPISVNSHLQCRASSADLSLPIAAMQEAGLTPEDIKSQKCAITFISSLSFSPQRALITLDLLLIYPLSLSI